MHARRHQPRFMLPVLSALLMVSALPTRAAATASDEDAGAVGYGEDNTPRVTVSWTLSLASRYLFQGLDYSGGKPVLQPDITLGYAGLSGSLWFNHDIHQRRSTRFDCQLQYERRFGDMAMTGGYAYLRYPRRQDLGPSQELFCSLGVESPLTVSVDVHYDFDVGDGAWFTASVIRTIEGLQLPISMGARLFYQRDYYRTTGFSSSELNLGTELEAGQFTLRPGISRFQSWENGDFRGDATPDAAWVVSLALSQEY